MAQDIWLGVLDQIPIRDGGTAATAINETFELAETTDRLGYSRYWLAEHHNAGSLACASPEVLIPQVAWRTSQIRVGSGGIMLPHYSSLKVAENFRTMTTQFPGRIDLGVGRAPGSDGRTARALVHGPGALGIDHFPEQLLDLYGWLADDLPPDHQYREVRAAPPGAPMPELWLLGSSHYGGHVAAELGWSHCFAHFISPEGGEQVVRKYRERFQPSPVSSRAASVIGRLGHCGGDRRRGRAALLEPLVLADQGQPRRARRHSLGRGGDELSLLAARTRLHRLHAEPQHPWFTAACARATGETRCNLRRR